MKRRELMTCSAALLAAAIPRGADAQDTKVLRFVPQADLRVLDPTWTTAYVTRNFAYMVYDTLLSYDAEGRIRPQMVDEWMVAPDGLTYRFRLRPGLAFHDGQPVRAADCVASLRRWGARDQAGLHLMASTQALEIDGDDGFTLKLNRLFPQTLACLAKMAGSPFVMPERLARIDPDKQIKDVMGSGPFTFAQEQWVPGQRAVFLRNPNYVPRSEPASGSAGGKVVHVDRVEWMILPDPATVAAAMASGEVDWWGYPTPDLVPLLRKTRGVAVTVVDPDGDLGLLRFNHLQPPFDKVGVRRAVALAMDRSDYLEVMGGAPDFWIRCNSFFPCGPASAPDRKPDLGAAKRLLLEAGYAGEPVVVLSAADQTIVQLQSSVTADLLRKINMTVDLQELDTATILTRRASKEPPSRGGWSIFHTWADASNLRNPAVSPTISANGAQGWFGWASDAPTETLIQQWYDAPDEVAQREALHAIDGRLSETVPYLLTGQFKAVTAYRTVVSGVLQAPALFFWNVRKA